MQFSKLIHARRTELGLTQRQLAKALRFARNGERTLRRWESGETSPDEPYRYAMEQLLGSLRMEDGELTLPDAWSAASVSFPKLPFMTATVRDTVIMK